MRGNAYGENDLRDNGNGTVTDRATGLMWVEAVFSPLRRESNTNSCYTAIYHDVGERKYFENLAGRNELTGLFNRRHFNDIGPVLLRKAQDEHGVFALILMDVDNRGIYISHKFNPPGIVTVSIGVCTITNFTDHDIDRIYQVADKALYQAKSSGRNQGSPDTSPTDATSLYL